MAAPSFIAGIQRISSSLKPLPASMQTRIDLRINKRVLFRGALTLQGEVDLVTTPVSRPVRLYHAPTGVLARETMSDPAGLYSFTGLNDIDYYYIVAVNDALGPYDTAITRRLKPS